MKEREEQQQQRKDKQSRWEEPMERKQKGEKRERIETVNLDGEFIGSSTGELGKKASTKDVFPPCFQDAQ